MIKEIFGKKVGMTQIFDNVGNQIGVTLVEVEPVCVLEKVQYPNKTMAKIGCFKVKPNRIEKLKKPYLGYFKKLGLEPYKLVREVSVTDNFDFSAIVAKKEDKGQPKKSEAVSEASESSKQADSKTEEANTPQREFGIEIFTEGEIVDVQAKSKGRGFSGGMKRWGWHGGPGGHGSMFHRRIGSNGSNTDPGRVLKGIGMPGHFGDAWSTVKKIKIVKIDKEKKLLFVKGSVPGGTNGVVKVKKIK